MNTLLRYIKVNGMKNNLSLTTFNRNLFERADEKRRRIGANYSSSFRPSISLQRYLDEISI